MSREVLIDRGTKVTGRESDSVVGQEGRCELSFWEEFELESGLKRVGEADTSIHRESAKYKVVELDARGRNRVAEGVVSLRKEFGEVVKEDEEDSLSSDVECTSCVGELSFTKEGCEETHESDQLTKERGPSLCIDASGRERR